MPDAPRTVYSSRRGRICRDCGRPAKRCVCRASPRAAPGDGVVRVRRELRRGKPVTTVSGLPLASDALRALAGDLKRRCGAGGSAKDGVIEIQGDQRERVLAELAERGYRAVRAGG
ncbi:MAG: stress response translation initiation inhibitor YciH [Deltaproteobacteria bacterium]|nr:MAG: stress response translation initiation inhibitor YciH [Deltaproteobacteria bacterium]